MGSRLGRGDTMPTFAGSLVAGLLIIAMSAGLRAQDHIVGPFRLGPRTAAIGVLEGDPRQEFGEISSVAILPDGRVVVLDRRIPSLRLFAPDGTPLFVAGRVGSGPGEFRLPSQVRLLPSGELAVLDVGLARLSFFRLVRDSLRFRRSFQVAPTAR